MLKIAGDPLCSFTTVTPSTKTQLACSLLLRGFYKRLKTKGECKVHCEPCPHSLLKSELTLTVSCLEIIIEIQIICILIEKAPRLARPPFTILVKLGSLLSDLDILL